ncbi:MAG TPA: peptide chain release factor N(5)-glutamine methyltransferase [Thermomicrobiaceae bacterium]|nr:peptide chain release factor N(5)-glutamine methyltransferase [Thermomicrobiaceae bacterium]
MGASGPSRTVRDLLGDARAALERAGMDTPRLDAEVLLMHVLDVDRAGLYLAYQRSAGEDETRRYLGLIARRGAGEPVAYLTGHREFMGLDFRVDRRVLVPRPETEFLVEWALARAQRWEGGGRVVDVGTGSGAVAVSLARLLPASTAPLIVGCDTSLDALRVARENASRLAPGRVALVAGDLLGWCRPGLDLVLANLPYLRADQAHAGLAHEPPGALFATGEGFDLYRRLLPQARALLGPDGALLCELDPDQRPTALALARETFPTAHVEVRPDLAGLDRYLIVDLARTSSG